MDQIVLRHPFPVKDFIKEDDFEDDDFEEDDLKENFLGNSFDILASNKSAESGFNF